MKKTLTALLLSGCLESDFKDAGHKPEENPCDTAVEDTAQDTADCVQKVIQVVEEPKHMDMLLLSNQLYLIFSTNTLNTNHLKCK